MPTTLSDVVISFLVKSTIAALALEHCQQRTKYNIAKEHEQDDPNSEQKYSANRDPVIQAQMASPSDDKMPIISILTVTCQPPNSCLQIGPAPKLPGLLQSRSHAL